MRYISCQTEVRHESSVGKQRISSLCTRFTSDTGVHSFDCRARFESIWTKELAEGEIASRTDDGMPWGPDFREIEFRWK